MMIDSKVNLSSDSLLDGTPPLKTGVIHRLLLSDLSGPGHSTPKNLYRTSLCGSTLSRNIVSSFSVGGSASIALEISTANSILSNIS